jgi:hypothetical protein
MAEYDDDRPDFDAAFRDEPGEDAAPARRRRLGRRDRERGREPDVPPPDRDDEPFADPPEPGGTGEIPRPSGETGEVRRPTGGGGFVPGEDFGFDEEPEPRPPRRASRGRGGRGGSRGGGRGRGRAGGRGGRGGTGALGALQGPRGRLALAVVFAIILIVVIVTVVKECRRNQLEDAYTQYVNGTAQLVTNSAKQGQGLREVLANPRGEKPPQLKAKIQDIARDAQGLVDQAEGLDPPSKLKGPQRGLVEALQYRVNGLTSLSQNLTPLLQQSNRQAQAAGLAQIMQRFLASDVIYEDSFYRPAQQALEDDDISGQQVPPAQPFLPNTVVASPEGAKSLIDPLERRANSTGGSTGALRGTQLVSTIAQPSDTRLTPDSTSTIQTTAELKWVVTVKNSGDYDESNVIVKASFSYPDAPNEVDERQVEIKSLPSGKEAAVEIPGPASDKVTFGELANLKIDVVAVPGETNVANNTVEYPVKITI